MMGGRRAAASTIFKVFQQFIKYGLVVHWLDDTSN